MPLKLTDWFPAAVTPVNPGEYNVRIADPWYPVSPLCEGRAQWLHKFGQEGFWRETHTADGRHTWSLLNVVEWQGREAAPRHVIHADSPAIPAPGAPRQRVQLLPPSPPANNAAEGKRCQICRVAVAHTTRKDSRGRNQAVCDSCYAKKSPPHLKAGRRATV